MLRSILFAGFALSVTGVVLSLFFWDRRDPMGDPEKMALYDQRREGLLQAGEPAPDVPLVALDGSEVFLSDYFGEVPLVLVFGSFT